MSHTVDCNTQMTPISGSAQGRVWFGPDGRHTMRVLPRSPATVEPLGDVLMMVLDDSVKYCAI